MTAPSSRWPQAALLGATCCGTSTTSAPATPKTPHWPDGPRQSTNSMSQPKPATITSHGKGVLPNWPWERKLLAICRPFLSDPSAVQGKLCRRIERHIKELFVFVAEPAVPSDNNPAERSRRHLVISRKVSGGTRSEQGTERKMTLASIFGTWRAQGLNSLAALDTSRLLSINQQDGKLESARSLSATSPNPAGMHPVI